MKRLRWLAFAVPVLLSAANVSPEAYLEHVKYLASPALKGRGTGTPELDTAADYIAAQFRSFGLKPVDGMSYQRSFPAELGAKLGTNNLFSYKQGDNKQELKEGRDFEPFSYSSKIGRAHV